MTRALLCLAILELAACGGAPPPAPLAAPAPAPAAVAPVARPPDWLSPAEPGIAPRPFTAARLREGMPVGLELRYRMEEPGKPPQLMVMKVTASGAETGTIVTTLHAEDGTLQKDLGASTARWDALVRHATFPEPATEVRALTVECPAGSFPGVEYVVRSTDAKDGAPVVTTYRFARDAPGPPVVLIKEKDGKLVNRMTLLSRT